MKKQTMDEIFYHETRKVPDIKKCEYCELESPHDPHEIFCGHGIREISIEYKLIVFVCRKCHDLLQHGYKTEDEKRDQQRKCFKILGIPQMYIPVYHIINKNKSDWDDTDYMIMKSVKSIINKKRSKIDYILCK